VNRSYSSVDRLVTSTRRTGFATARASSTARRVRPQTGGIRIGGEARLGNSHPQVGREHPAVRRKLTADDGDERPRGRRGQASRTHTLYVSEILATALQSADH